MFIKYPFVSISDGSIQLPLTGVFAFWDKTETGQPETVVISTHGLIKKQIKLHLLIWRKQKESGNFILKGKAMKDKPLKTYSLEEVTDKYIGKLGTPKREAFENELRLDLLGEAIRQARKDRHLTQEELGQLVGVKKAQISKLENYRL